jgi:hypothetical protein
MKEVSIVEKKLNTIKALLGLIEHYEIIYGNENKEIDRLHNWRDCICENVSYIVEARIKGER